jgi:hypothetical protein
MVKKKTIKVKTHRKVGNSLLDKMAYEAGGIKTKKIKVHTRKPPKKK